MAGTAIGAADILTCGVFVDIKVVYVLMKKIE